MSSSRREAAAPSVSCARRGTSLTYRPDTPDRAPDFPSAEEWAAAVPHPLGLWSGAPDPLAHTRGPSTVRLLWDHLALHVRGEIAFHALHLVDGPTTDEKRHGLWDFDVVEIFCSRTAAALPYGEVEGSPTGHWLDYLIEEPRRAVDRLWRSGAAVRGVVGAPAPDRFIVEIALPWRGLGAQPSSGTVLRGNVYAAQGVPGARRFLALFPTRTAEPDFHVPDRFGFLFLE